MTDTTTPAELEIPDAAKDQAFACGCARLDCRREGYQDDALPIIVAAELRRIVEEWYGQGLVEDGVLERLERRADELDGGTV